MKTITVECSDELHEQLQKLVEGGWAASSQEAVIAALKRFLDSHRPETLRQHVLKDVDWGLHGRD